MYRNSIRDVPSSSFVLGIFENVARSMNEINRKIIDENKIFLIYGVNEGAKKELTNKIIKNLNSYNIQKLNEKEILENQSYFIENFLTRSLFENSKIILINDASDKILKLIQEILEINDDQTKIILNSTSLEKKSKLRNFFEKDKKIYNSSIQTKGELLTLITSIVKKDKRVHVYISDKDKLKQEISINNLQESFKKILMRKFVNDYIKELEKNIQKTETLHEE